MENWSYTLAEHFSIIFGLTSGVLTLLGLIAIFISLSSQHNVEKARETIWELMKYPLKLDNFHRLSETEQKLLREEINYHFYIHKNIMNPNRNFTSNIIHISKWIIAIVCVLWLSSLLFIQPITFEFYYILASTIITIILMIVFIWILTKLNDIPLISKLPTKQALLHVNSKNAELDTLALATMMLEVRIVKTTYHVTNNVEYKLKIRQPIPFYGMFVEFLPEETSKFHTETIFDKLPLPKRKIGKEMIEKSYFTDGSIFYQSQIIQYDFSDLDNVLEKLLNEEEQLRFEVQNDAKRRITLTFENKGWINEETYPHPEGPFTVEEIVLEYPIDIRSYTPGPKISEEDTFDFNMKYGNSYKILTLNGATLTGEVTAFGGADDLGFYAEIKNADTNIREIISLQNENAPKYIYTAKNAVLVWVHPDLMEEQFISLTLRIYANKLVHLYKKTLHMGKFIFNYYFQLVKKGVRR